MKLIPKGGSKTPESHCITQSSSNQIEGIHHNGMIKVITSITVKMIKMIASIKAQAIKAIASIIAKLIKMSASNTVRVMEAILVIAAITLKVMKAIA